MSETVAAPAREAAPIGTSGDGFDVFASLRGGSVSEEFSAGTGGEDFFSSGAEEAGGADADETVSSLDLVAVASGKEKLDTAMSDANSQGNSEVNTSWSRTVRKVWDNCLHWL